MPIKQLTERIESPGHPINFNWSDNPAVKNLLDVVSSILAEEYVHTTKNNPEVFLNQGNQE